MNSDPRSQQSGSFRPALYTTWRMVMETKICYYILCSQDSVVNKVTRLSTGQSGAYFSLLQNMQTYPTAHPSACSTGNRHAFYGVKWLQYESVHSPSTSNEVREEWSYTSTLPTRLPGEHGTTVLHFIIIYWSWLLTSIHFGNEEREDAYLSVCCFTLNVSESQRDW